MSAINRNSSGSKKQRLLGGYWQLQLARRWACKISQKKKKKKANIAESAPLPGNEHDQIGPEALPSKRSQHLVD